MRLFALLPLPLPRRRPRNSVEMSHEDRRQRALELIVTLFVSRLAFNLRVVRPTLAPRLQWKPKLGLQGDEARANLFPIFDFNSVGLSLVVDWANYLFSSLDAAPAAAVPELRSNCEGENTAARLRYEQLAWTTTVRSCN